MEVNEAVQEFLDGNPGAEELEQAYYLIMMKVASDLESYAAKIHDDGMLKQYG